MDTDQYSLNNLREIVLPDPPSYWPPAPGVWIALGIVIAIALLVSWRLRAVRRRDAYRKAGLELLGDVRTSHDVSVILKRVALAVFPREQVASLYGDDWVAFLHRTCPRRYFSAMVKSDASDEAGDELIELASTWIRHHHVPEARPAATAS